MDLCVCFHVPRQKIEKHIRLVRPRFASQCSDCYGAGTGCGWCIPFIERLHERIMAGADPGEADMTPEEYRARRLEYLKRLRIDRLRPDREESVSESEGTVT